MKNGTDSAHPGRGVRIVALVIAGIVAFAVGYKLRIAPASSDGSKLEVVAPVVIPRNPLAGPEASGLPQYATQYSLAELQSAERLSDVVAYNPFGGINLNAEAQSDRDTRAVQALAAAARKRKEAPQTPPPTSLPPPAPIAPPLPFIAIGSISGAEVTGGQPLAFIKQQDRLLVVRAGDALGPSYRIESITVQRIEIMYLPLMQRQSLGLAP